MLRNRYHEITIYPFLCEIGTAFNFRSDNFDTQIYMHYQKPECLAKSV